MVEEGWCRDGVAASICVATTSLGLITHGQKQEETANPPGGCNASNHAISFDKAAEPMHSKTYVCVSAIGASSVPPRLLGTPILAASSLNFLRGGCVARSSRHFLAYEHEILGITKNY